MRTVIAVRQCMMCQSLCFAMYKTYAHSHCCKMIHVCVYVRACVSMFVCMCMNKAYANTVTPARLCMHVCECMNKAYVDTKLCMFTHICVCMNKAYAHCHCCEAMHVCVHVCSGMHSRTRLIVAMTTQTMCLPLCQTTGLSVS